MLVLILRMYRLSKFVWHEGLAAKYFRSAQSRRELLPLPTSQTPYNLARNNSLPEGHQQLSAPSVWVCMCVFVGTLSLFFFFMCKILEFLICNWSGIKNALKNRQEMKEARSPYSLCRMRAQHNNASH